MTSRDTAPLKIHKILSILYPSPRKFLYNKKKRHIKNGGQVLKGALCIFIGLCLIAAALLPLSAARASDPHYPIGQIAHLEGSAHMMKTDRKRTLKEGDPVFPGSIIKTAPDSKLLLLFIDDTRITLAENTELLIDEYVIDPYDSKENKAEFSVPQGAFYWVSGMVSKSEKPDVVIHNSHGSIGIRGTRFWAGEMGEGYGVIVDEGLVTFSGPWGSAELPKNASTFVTKANFTQSTDYWTPARKARAQKSVTFEMSKELNDKLKPLFRENIRKRHDYRGQMFPYKENPFRPRAIPEEEEDEFFSDEFKDMQQRRQQGQ